MARKYIPRDISWLSFNDRVLQEAADETNPLITRIKFLGIFSNNLDEFFRVRVAGLKRALKIDAKEAKDIFFEKPQLILDEINEMVIHQQRKFDETWTAVQHTMAKQKVYLKTATELSDEQQKFVKRLYDEEIESNIIPLLLDDNRPLPYLRDKSLFLGISMRNEKEKQDERFALIEISTRQNSRFTILPSPKKEVHVILLEEIIKFNLPYIFSYFGYDQIRAHAFKITRDAEFDLDNDINTTIADKIAKAVKNRRKGKPTRFVYDKEMDPKLLDYLIKRLNFSKKDSIIAGSGIHNFKHFMDFPNVFRKYKQPAERSSFMHPAVKGQPRVTDVVLQKDVLLSLPYHKFTPVIDLLREAAMDPDVESIKITAYRLAPNSKIANALINAVRNGKQVTVMLELRARFDEENNLKWKDRFETEGVQVLMGIPQKKVHAKLCVITKRVDDKLTSYGFVSTGNMNEKTAKLYGDYCLMTASRTVMADINRVFEILSNSKVDLATSLKSRGGLLFSPTDMRNRILDYLDVEIAEAKAGRHARIIIKVNSISDKEIIKKLYDAARAGVTIDMIVRSIYCATNQPNFRQPINAISIVDEYLEHARVLYFHHAGKEICYVSSADLMVRNLDYRLEAAVRISDLRIKKELLDMLNIQLQGNVKARILDNNLQNAYVTNDAPPSRAQIEIYRYLKAKQTSLQV